MPKCKKAVREGRARAAKLNEVRIRDKQVNEGPLPKESSNVPPMEISNNDLQRNKKFTADEASQDFYKNIEEFEITDEKEADCHETIINRRIIDVSYFLSELKRISNHGPLGCSFTELDLVAETQNGLQSKFTFKCRLCNSKFCINSDNCSDNYLNINTCAVAGTIAIGAGHSQLSELMAAINLPLLSEKSYSYNHELVSRKWENVLSNSMKKAAEIEREFAISNGRMNKDGIPIIDVVADGCWSKRSYKKKYNALSGAAAIIGKHSGELLYLGIKNKYCFICARSENKSVEVPKHKCFKNYSGPSTNMESEIIVEGFKNSINMHNLIYIWILWICKQ
ncbi:hypothetical protein ACJJTC_013676 [Scirpophaga incertulas]